MASESAKAKRRFDAMERLESVVGRISSKHGIERSTETRSRDKDIAGIQLIEQTATFLEGIETKLKGHAAPTAKKKTATAPETDEKEAK